MDYGKLASRRSEGNLMSALFTYDFIDVENCARSCKSQMDNGNVLQILWRQVLIAGDE